MEVGVGVSEKKEEENETEEVKTKKVLLIKHKQMYSSSTKLRGGTEKDDTVVATVKSI